MLGQYFLMLVMDESFSLSKSYEFDTVKKYHLILFSQSGDSNLSLQRQASIVETVTEEIFNTLLLIQILNCPFYPQSSRMVEGKTEFLNQSKHQQSFQTV